MVHQPLQHFQIRYVEEGKEGDILHTLKPTHMITHNVYNEIGTLPNLVYQLHFVLESRFTRNTVNLLTPNSFTPLLASSNC